jgi:hypothetical protein
VALTLKASPSEIVVKSGGGVVSRTVAVRSEEPFKILSADLKNCEGTLEQKELGKTGWSFSLALHSSSILPGAQLVVTTDHPLMPTLAIPVRLVK